MGSKTGIQWTDATWNPWRGCHKVSAGCKNCYMFREMERYGSGNPDVVVRSKTTFNDPLKWKEPKNIFTCSWSDFFIEEADAWRDEAWDVIRKTPQHTYQILTKRPENIKDCLPNNWRRLAENIIFIVTTESQAHLDSRVKILNDTLPGANIGISAEPLLEEIKISWWDLFFIKWVIAGGESGARDKVRMDNLDWYRSLRDQCQEAGIPFYLKQAWIDGTLVKLPYLDGRQWLEMPEWKGSGR